MSSASGIIEKQAVAKRLYPARQPARPAAMRLALYEPDIPQNTGTILRLSACLGVAVDIVEPCGFVFDDRRLRRAGMDYLDAVDLTRHSSWNAYRIWRAGSERAGRLILLTTKGDTPYTDFPYAPSDTLLFGRESGGVPPEVHEAADARLVIPMKPGLRSLNVAVAAAMVLGEALRQTRGFPEPTADDPAEQ
jgi:tRNA (cytidine/uridine-2'-O-)-methyltransferase